MVAYKKKEKKGVCCHRRGHYVLKTDKCKCADGSEAATAESGGSVRTPHVHEGSVNFWLRSQPRMVTQRVCFAFTCVHTRCVRVCASTPGQLMSKKGRPLW